MDKIIHRYELTQSVFTDIKLPCTAVVLKVGEQRGKVFVWVEVPCHRSRPVMQETFTFVCEHTGNPFSETWRGYSRRYLDTVMLHDGALVVHVYRIMVTTHGQ